jgi:O-antigen ligase
MKNIDFKRSYALVSISLFVAALLTTVAGINISMLLLLFVTPWFWKSFQFEPAEKSQAFQFFSLIVALCMWDIATNMFAGEGLGKALSAMQHDLRPFVYVVLLWPIFSVGKIARFALWAAMTVFVLIAAANLFATLLGFIQPGRYLWPTMHHLHGQMSVGAIFLLAQLLLVYPKLKWRVILPLVILVASMVIANERRAGYVLLLAGLPLWVYLNRERFAIKQNRWWLMAVAMVMIFAAASSSVVQTRSALVLQEIQQYIVLTPEQRAGVSTSIGIRLQFYTSIWELLKQSNWLVGVGSIQFGDAFSAVNYSMGTTPAQAKAYFANFENPHNEYLFMLATKGVIGLVLYVAIFVQACRLVMLKNDAVQRLGLLMFIFLFMLSITFNSMVIDMEEGHFTMLILLIFLAPRSLEFDGVHFQKVESYELKRLL